MMELVTAERVHFGHDSHILTRLADETRDAHSFDYLSDTELLDKLESILLEKIKNGDKQAYFQLGLMFFEREIYDKARVYFERSKEFDFQSLYQLAVMLYDGIGCEPNNNLGVEYLMKVVSSNSKHAKPLHHAAQFNIGRAHFQGYGVRRQSDDEAERWWLMAADDGNPDASVKAQTCLGLFYSRDENLDLNLAFFWHSEACGNGSLESQGALGVMYEYGIGVKKCTDSAYVCLKEAADRGNVYAMGNLISHYYRRKLFTKASDMASKVSQFENVETIASETDCLPGFIMKGIAIACFYYGRCLAAGVGAKRDEQKAKLFYTRCYQFDEDTCATLQNVTNLGNI